jgi:hypothetical protein
MKTILVLILCCGSVFAADTNNIRVVSAIETNVQAGSVITADVHARDGQTNLVRNTKTPPVKFGQGAELTRGKREDILLADTVAYLIGHDAGLRWQHPSWMYAVPPMPHPDQSPNIWPETARSAYIRGWFDGIAEADKTRK